jgi:hypothetical protein
MARTSHAERVSTITGFPVLVDTTPIAAPLASTIGEPDMPPAKNRLGVNDSQLPWRSTRP